MKLDREAVLEHLEDGGAGPDALGRAEARLPARVDTTEHRELLEELGIDVDALVDERARADREQRQREHEERRREAAAQQQELEGRQREDRRPRRVVIDEDVPRVEDDPASTRRSRVRSFDGGGTEDLFDPGGIEDLGHS